jgi:hypothetical protein
MHFKVSLKLPLSDLERIELKIKAEREGLS